MEIITTSGKMPDGKFCNCEECERQRKRRKIYYPKNMTPHNPFHSENTGCFCGNCETCREKQYENTFRNSNTGEI